MKSIKTLALGALVPALLAASPGPALAHRMWLLPSYTTLSGEEGWVTVDAAVSNDLFDPNHVALDPAQVSITLPDGTAGEALNPAKGKLRGTFDVHLTQQGTHKIAMRRAGVFGSYMLNGERKRLPRGARADETASLIPAGATNVEIAETHMRNETFVTLGAPSEGVFALEGKGLEMMPVTHPDDLVAGEPGVFRFLVDGAPAAGLKVTAVKGGGRWSRQPVELTAQTDAEGQATLSWSEPGFYWLEVEAEDEKTTLPQASKRRLGYISTLEVMAP